MKAIGYAFLVCSVFLVSACKKTTPTVDVNFHGRVTYQCDSSPVMGMVVDIIGYFHGNPNYNDYLGSPTTDDNGNYYLRGSVDKNADVMYYSVETTSKMNPKPAYF
ncbi:MAG: hypothetical protein NTV09_04045, partial [Bacteroidetes bacterium]|nr:hypothetical protein [Bacteroidota bacterium]